jgi:two-component system, OmpR family, phosphate regulon sensor histidine kinase PhoR
LLGPSIQNARRYSELLEISGHLHAVLDNIDSGVLLLDESGIVRYANTRLGALLHADVTHWPGQRRDEVMPQTLVPYTATNPVIADDLWQYTGPSRSILRRYAHPVTNRHGALLGSIEVYRDVTQTVQMNKLRDEFIAGAAHDLKTPVTAIKGYAQIALRTARRLGDERLIQQLGMVDARSDELTRLMDSLLDMSRIQGGHLRLNLHPCKIHELLEHVMRHFEFDLQRNQRHIDVELPATAIEVVWDYARIEAVLLNLIDNALKYSPNAKAVHVRVHAESPDAPNVHLSITDHGIGIPQEERELIFDRFYRVREAIEQGFKGTGIGLYIAQYVIQLHGGEIWADDALHGGPGTTFHIRIPRIAAQTYESS